ncbi:MAG: GIY-YIG nuclease family protein, partial [Flavobacteriales bacterium]
QTRMKALSNQGFFHLKICCMYFVYVLFSPSCNLYYKGFSEDVRKRLLEHNGDMSRYTAGKGPWELIVVERYATKREALIREKSLKRCKSDYFEWLRGRPQNILNNELVVG